MKPIFRMVGLTFEMQNQVGRLGRLDTKHEILSSIKTTPTTQQAAIKTAKQQEPKKKNANANASANKNAKKTFIR